MANENLNRIGVVSSVDTDTGKVRVVFPDMDDMVSPELPLLTTGTGWGLSNAMPEPGDNVACIFIGNGRPDGVCLGALYDGSYDMPADQSQRGIYFEDGSYVYFDKTTGSIEINAVGSVNVQAKDVSIKAESVQINGESVTMQAKTVSVNAETVQINGKSFSIDAPSVRMNSNVTVVGKLDVLNQEIGGG
ncbi:phage baseplate assembly protein V [Paenibacillus farraposensis]|uniref:Phage baseplate assembly protein V n=1 Tax=Paenibacillus farraposensis TaxID=2807095 RepID=A0ABW4DE38_9BACL|nr:phage baseplate assembly protein V [Paenibacillus farraposensis]MCC3379894.1 phage baseplate assembly protein V [Paenibacillus farraposensis]